MIVEGVDLREIVENDLGRPLSRGGKARMFRCPFHHEQHGHSLAVYRDGWRCYGACADFGDAVDWMQRFHCLSFFEACAALRVTPDLSPREDGELPAPQRPEALPPDLSWQEEARSFAEFAQSLLWKNVGVHARAYLYARGLSDETIASAGLGYWPQQSTGWGRYGSLWIAGGIVIPWARRETGELWNLKVRRAFGEPKYLMVKGGSPRGLYGVDGLREGDIALIGEGELDAELAGQQCPWLHAVTLGAASMYLPSLWRERLLACSRVLVATDNDKAGDMAAAAMLTDLPNAVRVKLPQGVKDLGDLHLQGKGVLAQWLDAYR